MDFMKRKFKHFLAATFIFTFVLLSTTSVMAAQKSKIVISSNKTYKSYDVTSDGKKDKFLIKFKPEKYLYFYVNGKKCYSSNAKDTFRIQTELCTLKNKKTYIHLKKFSPINDYLSADVFLTYKSGKFITSVNTLSHMKGAHHGRFESFINKIGSNYIQIMERACFNDIGTLQYLVTYKQSGHKLVPTSKTYNITYKKPSAYFPLKKNKWTSTENFHLIDQENQVMFNNPWGDTFSLYKIKFENKTACVYMKNLNSGLSGWYLCPNQYRGSYFLESVFI